MFVLLSDLFQDLSQESMNEISKIISKQRYQKDSVVYTHEDAARHFYVLSEGRIRLAIGREAQIQYIVSKPGEVFGWSSMVDREHYTSDAECLVPSELIRIEKNALMQVFEQDPRSGMIFFKRLAGAIVQRLVYNYEAFLSEGRHKGSVSFLLEESADASEI